MSLSASGFNKLSARETAAGIAHGSFTVEQVMRDCLDRIEAREPEVQAWVHLDPERLMQLARQADRRRNNGYVIGPLHGVPVGVKDVIDTVDHPTEHGSPLFAGNQPDRDAMCVTALREAGAIIMGKTVTTELANLNPNKTRNPRNPAHTPGGSSSGSAAAVADCHVPLALGTQTGGSVIRPASFNGIHGLKPTLGLIPRQGVLMQSHTLDTVGVFARSLDDIAMLTGVLSAHDPDDAHSWPRDREDLSEALSRAGQGEPRFAFLRTPAWEQADPQAKSAIENVVRLLGDGCFECGPEDPWNRVTEFHACVMAAEGCFHYGDHLQAHPELISDVLTAHIERGREVSARDYIEALTQREVIYRHLERLLDRFDAFLCLSSAGPAPKGLETTGTPIFNGLWTYLGVPCVSLPVLEVDGMPLGLQLVGKRGGDADLLRTASWLERWCAREMC